MNKAQELLLKSYIDDIKTWTIIANNAIKNDDKELLNIALETFTEKINMIKYVEEEF